jgi:hypothetical protein
MHILCTQLPGAFRNYELQNQFYSRRVHGLRMHILSSCKLSISACFCPTVIPILTFLIGLWPGGVLAGLRVLVATICGGAGKPCTSTELVDSVDLRFLERVGAISRT